MILEMDIGNSRYKYRVVDDEKTCLSGWGESEELVDRSSPFYRDLAGVDSIRVAAVGNSEWFAALERFAVEKDIQLWQSSTDKPSDLLSHGYSDPSQLGIDRWLAMLAARVKYKEASLLVVDAGSAVTLDLVEENQHVGGYICPGVGLNREMLGQKLALPEVEGSQDDQVSPGFSTVVCIRHGALMSVVASIEYLANHYLGEDNRIVLTGGDANQLATLLDREVTIHSDLVLDGLVVQYGEDC